MYSTRTLLRLIARGWIIEGCVVSEAVDCRVDRGCAAETLVLQFYQEVRLPTGAAKRGRLTAEKEDWLRENFGEFENYAKRWVHRWPRGDQVWLAGIAPHPFWEYSEDESAGAAPINQGHAR